jgi:hypothetical protein
MASDAAAILEVRPNRELQLHERVETPPPRRPVT